MSAAPAVTLVACQTTDPHPLPAPTLVALRKAVLDDIEPAITFVPLRRKP